jgi:hypothetical protein
VSFIEKTADAFGGLSLDYTAGKASYRAFQRVRARSVEKDQVRINAVHGSDA